MAQKISQLPSATPTGSELIEMSRLSATITLTRTDISAQASDNSYNTAAGDFIAAGFAAGKSVKVTGFTGDVANNIFTGVLTAVATGKLTIGGTDGDVIVDDAAGESVTITAWESVRGTPQQVADLAANELKGLTFTSDTGSIADSDPGAGLFKWNHATQASATEIMFNDATADAVSVSSMFLALEPGGFLFYQQADDATKWAQWRVISNTDASGYTKIGVALLAKGADIDDNKLVLCDISTGVCETWAFSLSDYKSTALAAATDVGGTYAPYAAVAFKVWASLHTPQTSGSILTIDVNEAGTSILSTKITIDNGENHSGNATTQPVISDSSIAAFAKISGDIDQVGDGTAKGGTVYMRVFRA